MENLRLYMSTFNVQGTSGPDQELKDLLSIANKKNENLPDFFILGFQELKAQPQNMLINSILLDDPWTYACIESLQGDYIKLKSFRFEGVLLVVFSLRKHLLNIRDIEAQYTNTGQKRGAVSIRFSISGCSICFVNCHLSPHDSQLKDRVEEYNSIIKDQEFHVNETPKILHHSYVFWMGDLNFRIREEFYKTREEIKRMILQKDYKKLFENDQLRYVMKKGKAFSEFTEQEPNFPPTFKFKVGLTVYDHKRRPAWCDRILYRVNEKNYENVTLNVEQLCYKHHPDYTLSDHRPVSAEFLIKVPQQIIKVDSTISPVDQKFTAFGSSVVNFEKITTWDANAENKAYFRFTKEILPSKDDWIGIFKENFSSLDDYLTYKSVSICSTPCSDSKDSPQQRPLRYEVTFSVLPHHYEGSYCLIYFHQTEDKVTSVLGVSFPFPYVKTDRY